MFLIDIVIGLIEDRPGSDVDDLMPDLPEYSRAQILVALQNSAFKGRLRCERQGGRGRLYGGAKPGRYYPVERKPPAPLQRAGMVCCVWDLGAQA